MVSKNALGNLINRYKAVLKKCHLLNTFGSIAVATMLAGGTVMMAPSLADAATGAPSQARDTGSAYYFAPAGGSGVIGAKFGGVTFLDTQYNIFPAEGTEYTLKVAPADTEPHFTLHTGVTFEGAAIYENFQVTVNGSVPTGTASGILGNSDISSTNFYLSTREGNGGALMTQAGATIGEISGNFNIAKGDAATYDKLLGEALTFTGGTGTITFDMEMDEVYSLTTVPTTFVQPSTVVTAGNLVGGTDVNILRVESNSVTHHSTVDSASALTIGQSGTADGTLVQGTMNNSGKLTLGSGIMQDTFQNLAGGTTTVTGATTFAKVVTNDSSAISVRCLCHIHWPEK